MRYKVKTLERLESASSRLDLTARSVGMQQLTVNELERTIQEIKKLVDTAIELVELEGDDVR